MFNTRRSIPFLAILAALLVAAFASPVFAQTAPPTPLITPAAGATTATSATSAAETTPAPSAASSSTGGVQVNWGFAFLAVAALFIVVAVVQSGLRGRKPESPA